MQSFHLLSLKSRETGKTLQITVPLLVNLLARLNRKRDSFLLELILFSLIVGITNLAPYSPMGAVKFGICADSFDFNAVQTSSHHVQPQL